MARTFFYAPTLDNVANVTSRFGTQSTVYKETEIGKLAKANGESSHTLVAVGDPFHGFIESIEPYTADGYAVASIKRKGKFYVIADGSEAAGTGNLAVGDQVVAGTPVAKDTAQITATGGFPKVRKATIQIGTTVAADLTAAAVQLGRLARGEVWTVVSLLGTDGAPGKQVLIERSSQLAD